MENKMNKRAGKILYSLWLTKDEAEVIEDLISANKLNDVKELDEFFLNDTWEEIVADLIKRGDIEKR